MSRFFCPSTGARFTLSDDGACVAAWPLLPLAHDVA